MLDLRKLEGPGQGKTGAIGAWRDVLLGSKELGSDLSGRQAPELVGAQSMRNMHDSR